MDELNLETVDMSNKEFIELLINYLSVLQEGRIKPDSKGSNGTVRDSKDNIPEIIAAKDRLSNTFKLDSDTILNERTKLETSFNNNNRSYNSKKS